MIDTRDEILEYIISKTLKFDIDSINDFSTNSVSDNTSVSRSLASHHLNELYKEGVLIKVSSRPVFFFHKETLENKFSIFLVKEEYLDINDLLIGLNACDSYNKNFNKLIGNEGSLKNVVDKIRSSVMYPPFGLPILITGNSGVGKRMISNTIVDFIKQENIVSKDNIRVVNTEGKNEVSKIILGKTGYIENGSIFSDSMYLSERSVLIITSAQLLSADDKKTIISLLEKNTFIRLGTNTQNDVKIQIILLGDDTESEVLTSGFINLFPVRSVIPDFIERYDQERDQLVISFFKEESLRMQKRILISNVSLSLLATFDYKDNLNGLKNTIRKICAQVNMINNEQEIKINIYHLPEEVLRDNILQDYSQEESEYFDVLSYIEADDSIDVIVLYEKIISEYNESFYDGTISLNSVLNMFEMIRNSSNKISFENKSILGKRKPIQELLYSSISNVFGQYNLSMSNSIISFITRNINLNKQYNSRLSNWESEHKEVLKKVLFSLTKEYSNESYIMEVISQSISNKLELQLDKMSMIIILITIIKNNSENIKRKNLGVIICHGYSTASSIADAVNTLLDSYVFDAYDMPLDTSSEEIANLLLQYINKSSIKSDVMLLVDMGSLEEIDKYLTEITNKSIGIINNVSTRLALDVGSKIVQNKSIEEIINNTEGNYQNKSKLIRHKSKNDIIAFVSDNGIHMADRLRKLFVKSLPRVVDIDIISLEFDSFKSFLEMSEDNILFVSGTFIPEELKVDYIPIEEMVSSTTEIQSKLNDHLELSEMIVFKENLIKNFSLQSIISSLTILEPNILLDFVIESISRLEKLLDISLGGQTKMGMYIHTSCLIERLVTKETVTSAKDLDIFKENQISFINAVNDSFKDICNHYRVEIPVSETVYIYDYIVNDRKKEVCL